MIKSGTGPTPLKHKDYDYLKSFGSAVPPTFPLEYFTDAGLWMPSQNEPEPIFNNPPLGSGCTDYSQAELASNLEKKLHNPMDLENLTHANARNGFGIRDSLDYARKYLKWFSYFFNIRAKGGLDYFDAFRVAQMHGLPNEQRSITWGTPWFPSWSAAIYGNTLRVEIDGTYTITAGGEKKTIIPMPTEAEFAAIRRDPNSLVWHNSVLDGWTSKNGVSVYRNKSWQGKGIGENGYIYFPREVINRIMAIPGTVGFVASQLSPESIQKVDLGPLQYLLSYLRDLWRFNY